MAEIKHIIEAPRVKMGNVFLHQALPYRGLDQLDPFLLIHHWKDELPGDQHQSTVGVGPHPHRGFSPVTLVFEGGVHHRDTIGNEGVIYGGGTQWMNSGSGLVHSERPDAQVAQQGGMFELIQFWVNSPAERKMEEPSYQPVTDEDTPKIIAEDGNVSIGVVAGTYEGKKGPVTPTSEMQILRVKMKAGSTLDLTLTPGYNSLSYQLDGLLTSNGEAKTPKKHMLVYDNQGGTVSYEAHEDTQFIVLSGKPIEEPVATYGPFVMNSQAEIIQALNDYQAGKMGVLEERFD